MLEEIGPVERPDQAHARDRVPDRDLVDGLAVALAAGDLFRRAARLDHPVLDPGKHRPHRQVFVAHALQQFDDEAVGQRRAAGRQLGEDDHGVGCPLACAREQAVGPAIREGALGPSRDLLVRQPTHVLDEAEPQHDRHGPQLADRERRHRLIALDVLEQVFAVEAGVGVGDEVQRERIDARIAGPWPVGQPRQPNEVACAGRSSTISRSCSSTTWKLSSSHSSAGTRSRRSRATASIDA